MSEADLQPRKAFIPAVPGTPHEIKYGACSQRSQEEVLQWRHRCPLPPAKNIFEVPKGAEFRIAPAHAQGLAPLSCTVRPCSCFAVRCIWMWFSGFPGEECLGGKAWEDWGAFEIPAEEKRVLRRGQRHSSEALLICVAGGHGARPGGGSALMASVCEGVGGSSKMAKKLGNFQAARQATVTVINWLIHRTNKGSLNQGRAGHMAGICFQSVKHFKH